MCKDQQLDDLKEFLNMLDFAQEGNRIWIIENEFPFDDLPATVQEHVKKYLEYIASIN